MSIINADIEAAVDYWRQIYSRLVKESEIYVVSRESVIDSAQENCGSIGELYGFNRVETDEMVESYIKMLRNAPITTPGVDPHAEAILDGLCERIEVAIKKTKVIQIPNIARGIEPKLGVYASRMGVMMTNASVITVSSQIFRFCNILSKALTLTVMIDPNGWDDPENCEIMREKLRTRVDVLSYWIRFVGSFTLFGSSVATPTIILSRDFLNLRGQILDALEIYIIAHEYSHHILRHGQRNEVGPIATDASAALQEEFDADSLAIMLSQIETGHKLDENPLMTSGAGMALVLLAIKMIDDASSMMKINNRRSDCEHTHPTIERRLLHIEQNNMIWQNSREQLKSFRNSYIRIMNLVWSEIKYVFDHTETDAGC